MPVRTSITSGDQAAAALASLVPMLLVCCSGGTVGQVYSFEPGGDVTGALGGGIGADAVCAVLRGTGNTVKAVVCDPTWSGAPSITHTGTGPTVTCALADGSPGCYDDHQFLLTVTTGGAGGAGAAFSVCYDGATVVETVPVPAENPAVLQGSIDITNGAVLTGYVANVLTPLHLDFTAPSADVITFGAGSLAAANAGLRAAFATSVAVQTWTSGDLLAAGIAAILAHPRKLIFTTTGATPADAPADCTITGTRYGAAVTEVLTIGQVLNDVVSSVNTYDTITSIVFAAGQGNGALIALGYSSAYADAAEIVTDFNAAAVLAGLEVTASIAETADGQFLLLTTNSAGSGVSLTIDAGASTADTPLGFSVGASNLDADGSAATWSPPWTGLTFTFPATSTYVVGDTYTATATGPRADVASLVTGAIAAHDNYAVNPFGFLVVAQPAPNANACRAIQDALKTLTNGTWTPDPYRPIFVTSIVGSQFHTASSTRSTNNTNITAADAALILAFTGAAANLDSVAVDDVYLPGDTSLVLGSFRRTAALVWAVKNASKLKLAADVADGTIPEATLLGPDGLTYARDASVQTTHLESNLGFSCLRSVTGPGVVKFCPGYTRAGNTSRLRFEGPVTVALSIATIVFPIVNAWEGETDVVDPLTGQLTDNAKKQRANQLFAALDPTLRPQGGPPNVSDFPMPEILNPSSGRFVDNGEVRVKIVFYVLGEIITVYVNIAASGVAVTSIAA